MGPEDRDPDISSRPSARADAVWLGGVAAAAFLLHISVLSAYGWFRDDLYYAASSEHLAFGYVGFPPLAVWIARCTRALLGDSLGALRIPSILAGSAVVFLAGWLARELGGGRTAQILASLCCLISPVYLFAFHVYSMNSFDILFWTLGALIAVRILASGDPPGAHGEGRLWLLFGIVFGLGLENKHSLLLFGFGLAAGLLLTPQRSLFRNRWLWLGGLLACVLILPNLLWEHSHGWPTWEYLRSSPEVRSAPLSFFQFFVLQVFQMHPLTFPVWLAGLAWLLVSRPGRSFRPLGWMYVVSFVVLLLMHVHIYYLASVYPVLFAAGGVAVEAWMRRAPSGGMGARGRRLRPALLASFGVLLVIGGALTAPFTLPLLPVASYLRYARAGHLRTTSGVRHPVGALPQHFADMHGWQDIVAEVARVYRSLPAEERRVAGVLTQNCGDAAAIDVFGPAQGLPKAVSGHDSYFLWGPRGYGEVLLVVGDIGGDEPALRRDCRSLERAGTIHCGLCMPYENEQPVWICRGIDLPAVWPRLKRFQ